MTESKKKRPVGTGVSPLGSVGADRSFFFDFANDPGVVLPGISLSQKR